MGGDKELSNQDEAAMLQNRAQKDANNKSEVLQAEHLHAIVKESLHFCKGKLHCTIRPIPLLGAQEVDIENLLGTGSFSQVFRVNITSDTWTDEVAVARKAEDGVYDKEDSNEKENLSVSSSTNTHSHYVSMASCVSANSRTTMTPKYALKQIRRDFLDSTVDCALGIKDAYYEAEILSHVPPHVNVCRLVALSQEFWKDPAAGFMILERVSETLKQRMARWTRTAKYKRSSSVGPSSNLSSPFSCLSFLLFPFCAKARRRQNWLDQRSRLDSCAIGIAKALEHLHKHGIVYRDLKPTNVGFGYDGYIKLFDFGLARTVQSGEDAMRLSGNAGTARYMAPEVATYADYSFPADVHSFAILMWEICTLQRPYGQWTSLEQLSDNTVKSHQRPDGRQIAHPALRQLLTECWDPEPWTRPDMPMVIEQLEHVVLRDEEDTFHNPIGPSKAAPRQSTHSRK